MVKIELHGILGEKMKKNLWKLSVFSVSEAVRAIECNTGIFYKTLYNLDKENIKYRILINGQDFKIFKSEEEIKNDFEKVINSNLFTKFNSKDLSTIDIIPVLEGDGGGGGGKGGGFKGVFGIVFGVALAFTGIGLIFLAPTFAFLGLGLVVGGLGIAATGFLGLMSSPPPFVAPEFQRPDVASPRDPGGGGRSYLFNGPSNSVGEGGPVPIGYGRLVVGSKTISATFYHTYVAGQAD